MNIDKVLNIVAVILLAIGFMFALINFMQFIA